MSMLGSPTLWHQVVLALAASVFVAAAVWDARKFRIPNLISLALLVLFPAYCFTSNQSVVWGQHLLVAGLVLVAGFFLYTKKILGAGDVKLLSAASLWAGPGHLGVLLFVTAVAGGLLALATMCVAYLKRRKTKGSGRAPLAKNGAKTMAKTPIPYGVAIAVGGLCTLILLFHPLLLSS